MANFSKSFNFRNGVQVDEDNLVVNSNGLVGIGTSVPTEFLDVRGTAKVVGLVTASQIYSGIATIVSLNSTGANISGVLTASSIRLGTGPLISTLVGYATDAWVITASGITTTVNVGIGSTTDPTQKLDVSGSLLVSDNITCTSGDITATSGNLIVSSGDVTISAGNINISLGSINVSSGNINAPSGIITASSFSGSLNANNLTSGTVSNSRLPSNLNISGIITASQGFVGNITGTASTAQSLTGSPNITVTNITASNINSSGIITATTKLYTESIGIGTSAPSSDIQIKRSGQAKLQVTSDTNASLIGLGRSDTITGYNGILRYGNTSALFPYSTPYSLDILNYGSDNINFYLEASNVSAGTTGSFHWHRKPNFARLMTLTYDGKLGIGVTQPSNTLEVVGTSTVTSDAYFGNDVKINGDLTVSGNLAPNSLTISEIQSNVVGNVFASSGISTFSDLQVTEFTTLTSVIANTIGIGTDAISEYYDLDLTNGTGGFRTIGIGTTVARCAVDLADAGKGVSYNQFSYMILPRLSNSDRVGLTTVSGAVIFNTTTNKFQGYTGSAWVDFH